ncbi:C-type mannose receptor 2-like isoform X2 [Pomacea canaliculata]|uniref:C-type mannose receptor 2-like isoform X2 n=1 Tax=Pomacea canaliculata TaxID=400727 RepID=UPI000D729492|nr:C-type mannose receptor 2-like isoform X2 [Pomacea canaliculata]
MTDNWGSGWMLLNSTCYYLSLEPANWSSALTSCKEKGADLLSLESWTEQSQKLSKMKFAAYERIWWIGLQSNSSVSKWVSLYDNSSFSGEIILWNEGEPNNIQSDENCVEMYPWGALNDASCHRQKFYICKKYLKLFNVSRNSCDNNWILILDSCYYLSTTAAVQWTDAQRKCNELGANLLTLESLDELLQIRRETWRFTVTDRWWWVGLRKVPSSGKWQWIKKPPILSPVVTQWKKDVLNTEDCVVMDSDGFLSDMPCNSSRYFICVKSREDADNCDSGWIKIFSMCYKLSNKALSWSGAEESCKTEGGKLLVVRTFIEMSKIQENINLISSPWWVGLKRASPSNFDLKQDDGSKECGMIASDNFLTFKDCKALHSYICQKNHTENTTRTVESGLNWFLISGVCLKQSTKTMSWSQAQESCKLEGGNLMSMSTLQDLTLTNLGSSRWWIGERTTSLKCVAISSSVPFHVEDCNTAHPYICEKRKYGVVRVLQVYEF